MLGSLSRSFSSLLSTPAPTRQSDNAAQIIQDSQDMSDIAGSPGMSRSSTANRQARADRITEIFPGSPEQIYETQRSSGRQAGQLSSGLSFDLGPHLTDEQNNPDETCYMTPYGWSPRQRLQGFIGDNDSRPRK